MNRNKILLPVKGGLGNQMFFYAFSLYMSQRGSLTKLVWFHYLFTKHHGGIELYSIFNSKIGKLPLTARCYLSIGNLLHFSVLRRCFGKLASMKYYKCEKYVQRNPYSFEDFFIKKDNRTVFMDGFWQNYMYLSPIREELLEIFKFKLPQDNSCFDEYLHKMRSTDSVSIHIRRGDYLEKQFSELNVIRSIDYYYRAIKFMLVRKPASIFFVFTDDPQWAKKHLKGENIIFVEGNFGSTAYLDMYLMSQCKCNIIANSTFSWWGAWLNQNSEKLVIAPSMWTKDICSKDLCPPEWILLSV